MKINNQTKKYYQSLFDDMISHLSKKIQMKAVILFGSRAKGIARKTSAYDIILIGDFKERFIDRGKWVSHWLPSIPIDVFCYTADEFEEMFKSFNITAIDGIGEGLVLYGKKFVIPYQERYAEFVARGMKKYKCVLLHPPA